MSHSYDLQRVELKPLRNKPLSLSRIAADTPHDQLEGLAGLLSGISPWVDIELKSQNLLDHFTRTDPALFRFLVIYNGETAGAISVRNPWLKGPYLELLGLSPHLQGIGIGRQVMAWFEREAPDNARSLWLLCSDFNHQAISFYQTMGFEKQCLIENLYRADFHDYLMRKRVL